MLILVITAFLGSNIVGCSGVKPIEVVSKPIERTPLALPMPDSIRARSVQWIVITPENAEAIFQQMEAQGRALVLFAMTDDSYQELALTMADIRNLIATQRSIIIKYQSYYEPNITNKK